MKEFYSIGKKGEKELYRKTRRKYKRWIVGNLCALFFLYVFYKTIKWVVVNGEGYSFDSLIVGVGLAFPLFIVVFVCRALAVSGGREVFLNRAFDKVVLSDNWLSMEYVPHVRNRSKYNYIVYKIRYLDISSLIHEDKKGRLRVSGNYQINWYINKDLGDTEGNLKVEDVSGDFFLYGHYENFEELLSMLNKKSGYKIDYNPD